uniref:Uncharacterized protein n=2 Tax=Oryza sativa subsp. japonica TaxID=39947 RepID=Q53JV4_ORYSJ|nr:hypothetical protein LOC_Os11g22990 [Oryza sativa Japonica Group]ABA93086.1 hypothetical protein LOC_Os11g22989 [Oryza sativa Japonica Group]
MPQLKKLKRENWGNDGCMWMRKKASMPGLIPTELHLYSLLE